MSENAVTVGVCTYRRASLRETLASLACQELPTGWRMAVVVADNDDNDDAQDRVEGWARELGLDLTYVHAPARNISIGRNACLDACGTDWFAFIDDDEAAARNWLSELLALREGRDIVFGSSRAVYEGSAAKWLIEGDFHSNSIRPGKKEWNGYTCNVLMRRPFVENAGLRFEPRLGQTGGEDTMFFLAAHQAGALFGFAPDALVTEGVPPARAQFGWLVRRHFRSGQIHRLVLDRSGKGRAGPLLALGKVAACLAMAALRLPNGVAWRRNVLRGALHMGVVAAALGFPLYREYGNGRR